jgi:hypothetical protein
VRLPNASNAIIPDRKIRDYLLSLTHRDGRSKALFFMRFGFSSHQWERLAEAIHLHALTHPVIEETDTPFGISYTIDGMLITPDGRNPAIRVIWFVETDEQYPRLVTAYPLKGSDHD